MNVDNIKNILVDLANKYNTIDVFEICNLEGIEVKFKNYNPDGMKAYYTKVLNKTIIYINSNYDLKSQKLLCAHELGHIKLHPHCIVNHFHGSNEALEYEANLFAAYFMLDENLYSMSFCSMNSYILKNIIDKNLKLIN